MVANDAFDVVIVLGIIGAKVFALRAAESILNLGKMEKSIYDDFMKSLRVLEKEFLDRLTELMAIYNKPIVTVSFSKSFEDETIHDCGGRFKCVIYDTPEEAVLCVAKMYNYYNYVTKRSMVYA